MSDGVEKSLTGHHSLMAFCRIVRTGIGSREEEDVVGVPYFGLRFSRLGFVGLGFLTESDVKDVEVVCASFAGGVFLESPELFRALDQPCSVQRLLYSFSKSPSRLASSWISFFCCFSWSSLFY